MPVHPIPYLIVSQHLDAPSTAAPGGLTVFVCINLLDHRAIGIALSRDAALDAMSENFDRLNASSGFDAASLGQSKN